MVQFLTSADSFKTGSGVKPPFRDLKNLSELCILSNFGITPSDPFDTKMTTELYYDKTYNFIKLFHR